MKKTFLFMLAFVLLLMLNCVTAFADLEELENAVPEAAKEVLGDVKAEDADSALNRISGYLKKNVNGLFTDALKNGAAIVIIPVICALAGTIYNDKLPDAVTFAGVTVVSALCFGGTSSFIGAGKELLDELGTFSKILLPALTTAAAASGAVTSAAAKYAAAALFIEVLIALGQNMIIPLIYAYVAAAVGGAAFDGGLNAAAKLIKWVIVTCMTILVMVFTIYLSVTGIVSGTADAAATKVTKSVLSTALPVVGGIISDAASAVVSGTSMLKSTIGVFGMIVILAVCAVPFMRLGVNYLIFKGAAAVAEPLGGTRLSKVINAAGTAMGMLLGLCGSMAVMLYISIISLMKVVS